MLKQYLKQAWQLMKQNRFYTAVYIIGTGLAIAMVMVMAIVYHIRTANIAPEVNRDRMLIVSRATASKKGTEYNSNWGLSYETLKACYYTLETPEMIAAAVDGDNLIFGVGDFYTCLPGGKDLYKSFIQCTDANFWKIFRYDFIQGKPYTEEDFQSGMRQAVLSESLARRLFHSSEAVGRSFMLNDVEYRVSGVVKDVSPVMPHSYAELWVPFTSISSVADYAGEENIVGMFTAYLLYNKPEDIPLIEREIEQKRIAYNLGKKEWEYRTEWKYKTDKYSTILTYKRWVFRQLDFNTDFHRLIIRYGLIAFMFLLIPGVNLSGLTSSRMQEQIGELGIRKAFGATRSTLMGQVLTENFLLTFFGGIAGLLFSYLIVWRVKDTLLSRPYSVIDSGMDVSGGMLLNLPVFFYALGFCFVLNFISSYIPVRHAASRPIVDSIHDK